MRVVALAGLRFGAGKERFALAGVCCEVCLYFDTGFILPLGKEKGLVA